MHTWVNFGLGKIDIIIAKPKSMIFIPNCHWNHTKFWYHSSGNLHGINTVLQFLQYKILFIKPFTHLQIFTHQFFSFSYTCSPFTNVTPQKFSVPTMSMHDIVSQCPEHTIASLCSLQLAVSDVWLNSSIHST